MWICLAVDEMPVCMRCALEWNVCVWLLSCNDEWEFFETLRDTDSRASSMFILCRPPDVNDEDSLRQGTNYASTPLI